MYSLRWALQLHARRGERVGEEARPASIVAADQNTLESMGGGADLSRNLSELIGPEVQRVARVCKCLREDELHEIAREDWKEMLNYFKDESGSARRELIDAACTVGGKPAGNKAQRAFLQWWALSILRSSGYVSYLGSNQESGAHIISVVGFRSRERS